MYMEIRDQPQIMKVEGTADHKPSKKRIIRAFEYFKNNEKLKVSNLIIYFDTLQLLWRFTGSLHLTK